MIVYLLWSGDTPDKGIATEDIVAFGEARAALRSANVDFRYALIPVLSSNEIPEAVAQLIKEKTK